MDRKRKRELTEDALLTAARKVFAEKGYHNAKITDITREAGRSAGSFYNYYDNKAQLLDALLDQFAREVTRASLRSRSDDPYESIRGAVAAYWTTFREHVPEMIGLRALAGMDQRYTDRWRSVRSLGLPGVIQELEIARAEGHLVGTDLTVLASAIVSMLESFCWTWLAGDGDIGVSAVDDDLAIRTLADFWYGAVYGPVVRPGGYQASVS